MMPASNPSRRSSKSEGGFPRLVAENVIRRGFTPPDEESAFCGRDEGTPPPKTTPPETLDS